MLIGITKNKIKGYTDENLFTEEVVIPLFERLANFAGYDKNGPVKIEFWGKDKRLEAKNGIDVMFGYKDHFDATKHIGIQCKIKNIRLGSNASLTNSIETIKNQIDKAYKYTFTSTLTAKEPTRINGFYLITSKSISPEARDFYRELGFINIEFLDCDNLIYLINKLFPENKIK